MSTEFVLPSAISFPVALWIETPGDGFAYQGCKTAEPLRLFMYAIDDNPHTIKLYSQGSRSIPYQNPQNKWSHLNPQWRFTDTEDNVIEELTLTNNILTSFGNGTTGYLASAEFYYIDDMPTTLECPLVVWATVDYFDYPVSKDVRVNSKNFPGFSNSRVAGAGVLDIKELTPVSATITRDGINPMFPFYWKDLPIAHIVSVIGTDPLSSCYSVMKNVPVTNEAGVAAGPVIRELPGIDNTYLEWAPISSQAYLSAVDEWGLSVGGYLRGTVESSLTASNITITTQTSAIYETIPDANRHFWISNPNNNTLNRITVPFIKDEWIDTAALFLPGTSQNKYDITSLQLTAVTDAMSLTGFGGIYGIAVDEYLDVWCADLESDRVYKFDSEGQLLSTLNFGEGSAYPGATGGSTPAGISIDGNNKVWLTFFDSVSVVRLNELDGSIEVTINPSPPDFITSYPSPCYDPAFKPVLAEPDEDNEIWITYSNSLCSVLQHYDNDGVFINSVNLPLCSNPMDIYTANDNNMWVSLTYNAGPTTSLGQILKIDRSTYATICSIPATNPSYITLDNEESLWFTHSGNTLSKITTAGVYSHFAVGASVPSWTVPSPGEQWEDNALEGLTTDINGRVHVINSIDNTMYSIVNNKVLPCCYILPDENLEWYNDGGGIYTIQDPDNRSARAFGDWNGSEWQKKYGTEYGTATAFISGSSSLFNIDDFKGLDVRRFNESWNTIDEIKKNIKRSHILENPVLWDKYMQALWGDASTDQGKSFGREAYERIANFNANHADINTCNVDQLYDLARHTDVPIDIYGVSLPPELKRMMDIASINQQILWGDRCKCSRNLSNKYKTTVTDGRIEPIDYLCQRCDHYHPGNQGELFNPQTYTVSAGVPFIIEDKTQSINNYTLITPPASCVNNSVDQGNPCDDLVTDLSCITSYPLSSFYHLILPEVFDFQVSANKDDFEQVITYFCFYEYVPGMCPEQISGVINWDDEYTTMSEYASSIDTWYGAGQNLEKIFNYILHKGLGLAE